MKLAKGMLGQHGLFGVFCGTSLLLHDMESIYDYYDNPGKYIEERDRRIEYYLKRMDVLMAQEVKPDFICTGGSGTLVFQSEAIFRELGLPIVQAVTRRAKEYGIPSHIHSCGPETKLVQICAEETDLTVIDPLEIPPMGDCNLADIKRKYGERLVLKGNLHTTDTMLRGSVQDVINASKKAIDDGAAGGRFILSTGDQCGRDTPDENLAAMIETARTYGKY
jgi:uroporphyrinogen decarboxylase